MLRWFFITIFSLSLMACATTKMPPRIPQKKVSLVFKSPRVESELAQGRRLYEAGYYKRAMHELLPLACDGNSEAQYAVGYMYYYGMGVAQDTDVGDFWIHRSARHGYGPAMSALTMISEPGTGFKARDRLFK